MQKKMRYFKTLCTLLFVIIMVGATSLVQAQDETIEFPGEIIAIDGNIISVGGIAVDTGSAILPGDGLTVGMTVQVIGTRQDQTILATIIVITDFGTEPDVPEEPTEEPDIPEVTEEPDVPDATQEPAPSVIVNVSTLVPIIVIEGPVQAINVSSITIFDIDIEVDSADVILTQIRIGDTVRVEGKSSFTGDTIVIVAVNITIVQTTLVVIQNYAPGVVYVPSALPPNCKRKKSGKITCKKNTKKSSKKNTKKSS
jgi:hypothetical protein